MRSHVRAEQGDGAAVPEGEAAAAHAAQGVHIDLFVYIVKLRCPRKRGVGRETVFAP